MPHLRYFLRKKSSGQYSVSHFLIGPSGIIGFHVIFFQTSWRRHFHSTLNSRFAKLCACPADITSETFITFILFRSLSAEFISCRRMTVFILAIFPLQSLITPYKSRKNQEEFAAPTGHLLSSSFNNEYLLTRSDFFSQTIKQV